MIKTGNKLTLAYMPITAVGCDKLPNHSLGLAGVFSPFVPDDSSNFKHPPIEGPGERGSASTDIVFAVSFSLRQVHTFFSVTEITSGTSLVCWSDFIVASFHCPT